jgi:predicted DNA-binding transcriptional regulator AlpA
MKLTAEFLADTDVAKRLPVRVHTLRKWRREDRGPKFFRIGALVRYRAEDLDAWLASRPSGGDGRQERGE